MPKCVSHEYSLSRGDRLLKAVRRLFHKNPEFRHDSFRHAARFAPVLPFIGGHASPTPELSNLITFDDGSAPIRYGNPIILAAGANKTAFRIADYANVGFGGITVGTATRRFREGNTHRPRIGFLEGDRAIHNSMGLNNEGVKVVARRTAEQLAKAHEKGLCVGISVAETPGLTHEAEKLEDILDSFGEAYHACDYVELNVSCPNTGEGRLDLDTKFLEKMLAEIAEFRAGVGSRKAVFAKLSPDLPEASMARLLDLLSEHGINGVVLGNTYPTAKLSELPVKACYDSLAVLRADGDKGGLSGRPLYETTFRNVERICKTHPHLKVVACGGIDHGYKVFDLLELGACAVQCYSVVAFRWLAAHQMRRELMAALRSKGFGSLREFYAAR